MTNTPTLFRLLLLPFLPFLPFLLFLLFLLPCGWCCAGQGSSA
jgi:hypothetical protein